MPYKLIISDIDGTFLNSEKKIPAATIDICRRLHAQKGVRFALASGRGARGIKPVIEELGLPVSILACNAAEIFDEDGRLVYSNTLSLADALAIKKTAQAFDAQIETITYADDDWIADEFTDVVKGECFVMPTAPVIGRLENVITDKALIQKVICVGTVDNTSRLIPHISAKFPQCDFFKSQLYILEAVAKGVNKAAGIDVLCRHYGIDVNETIAFGDSYNDKEMLESAGLGIAMGNAPGDIKAAAKSVTASNDDDGIAKALQSIYY